MLSTLTGLGERTIRNEIELLKRSELVRVNNSGIYVTEEGIEIIEDLNEILSGVTGLSQLEEKLKIILDIENVVIVPGDSDEDKLVLNDLGKSAAQCLMKKVNDNSKVALTGGYSVKALVDNLESTSKYKNISILPARGGMGRIVEIQSNTLAADLAKKLGGTYKLLYAPDSLSDTALEAMKNEKGIKEILENIKHSDILIYGIGSAEDMAARRDLTEDIKINLKSLGAVGEAFGIYFDNKGNNIYSTPTIGLDYEDLDNIDNLIAIAGGKSKAQAVLSVSRNRRKGTLITDQKCAEEIIKITCENKE